MTLDQQVVSLELARKLKELGVKQESVFVWYTNADFGHLLYLGEDGMRPMEAKTYSAFTVAELGNIIYTRIKVITPRYDLDNKRWQFELVHIEEPIEGKTTGLMFTDKEADIRAEQLIFLIKHEQITL